MTEFTGERVVPGQVDPDLWNEHLARYAFAARLGWKKRVLDAGCGTGYGTAELARVASRTVGVDVSPEAVEYAAATYRAPNLRYLRSSCAALPFAGRSFDLVVAFEVIEHIEEWPSLIREAHRVLSPGGQFIVSTPNKAYYADSRRQSGPNPFHVHEFEFDEFRQALLSEFPHVSMFVENHVEGIVFRPVEAGGAAEVRVEGGGPAPAESHFFLAVCACAPQTGAPTFIYLPSTTNLLRERELHIARLEEELATKDRWIDTLNAEKRQLVDLSRAQTEELEEKNRWAEGLNRRIEETGQRIVQLQAELDEEHRAARGAVAQYEAKVAELEQINREKTEWAQGIERRIGADLEAARLELAKCVALLDSAERTVEERTNWALSLDRKVQDLEAKLAMVQASRWIRLGRTIGLGPELGNK